MSGNSFKNLKYFIRVNALVLLLLTVLVESKVGSKEYVILNFFEMLKGGWLNIPLMPGMSVQFVSHGWFPIFIELFSVFAFGFLFFKPQLRLSYILATAALILRNTASHLTVGVHTSSVYLPTLFLLALEPPTEQNSDKIRGRLITAIAMMYFFSAVNKLNPNFLSGEIVEKSFYYRLSFKSFLDWIATFKATVLLGPLLEFFAFFMLFKKTRKFGMASALLFHLSVSVWIFLSVSLTLFGCSILLLMNKEHDLKKYYHRLSVIGVILMVGLYFTNYLTTTNLFKYQTLAYDLLSVSLSVLATGFAFKLLSSKKTEPVTYYSKLGFILPITYAATAFALSWPEPFGYTQYSGLPRKVHAVILPLHQVKNHPEIYYLNRRWRTRGLRFSESNEFVALFPTQTMSKVFLDYYCQVEPQAEYKTYVPTAGENLDVQVQDYDFRRNSFDGLSAVPCTESAD